MHKNIRWNSLEIKAFSWKILYKIHRTFDINVQSVCSLFRTYEVRNSSMNLHDIWRLKVDKILSETAGTSSIFSPISHGWVKESTNTWKKKHLISVLFFFNQESLFSVFLICPIFSTFFRALTLFFVRVRCRRLAIVFGYPGYISR